ncbi:hypothetical protein [Jatrophihabitans sp.]|uniref:hypothetical protein n=1 Tax=Jatrophihabitans sp. TaxID=1932789 RepID=UPI0030C668D4|nr:hypothetical protein [Jatrophihabitans sp.]
MRFPIGNEVPFTAGVSGIVFAVAVFNLGSPIGELVLFVLWGLIYAVECAIRRPHLRGGHEPGLDVGTAP